MEVVSFGFWASRGEEKAVAEVFCRPVAMVRCPNREGAIAVLLGSVENCIILTQDSF